MRRAARASRALHDDLWGQRAWGHGCVAGASERASERAHLTLPRQLEVDVDIPLLEKLSNAGRIASARGNVQIVAQGERQGVRCEALGILPFFAIQLAPPSP